MLCADATATQVAMVLSMNCKTLNRYYGMFRVVIYVKQHVDLDGFTGTVDVDEGYFGAECIYGVLRPAQMGRGISK